jgi:RNA-directed DNA polymerase
MTTAHALEQPLLESILARDNLQRAWRRVKANKGAAGVDAVSLIEFPGWAREHWPDIKHRLMDGDYQPQAVRRVWIPKANGDQRPLGIPTIADRIIQQAIAQQLAPHFEREFSEQSYGFRPGRNAHQAVRQVRDYIRAGYRSVVDIDLAAFFDSVNHDVLMRLIGQRMRDKRVLRLIGRYLRAGVVANGQWQATTQGVPQGGPPQNIPNKLTFQTARVRSVPLERPVRQGTRTK